MLISILSAACGFAGWSSRCNSAYRPALYLARRPRYPVVPLRSCYNSLPARRGGTPDISPTTLANRVLGELSVWVRSTVSLYVSLYVFTPGSIRSTRSESIRLAPRASTLGTRRVRARCSTGGCAYPERVDRQDRHLLSTRALWPYNPA